MYFVSRQCYWGVDPEEQNVVEIASGGHDYANPDMLVPKYTGEGQDYLDPVEAVEAALRIAEEWKFDSPKLSIGIAHGFTGGNTMPFEPDEVEQLKDWAKKAQEELPRCDRCGAVRKETFTLVHDPDRGQFCSDYCAEMTMDEDAQLEEECEE